MKILRERKPPVEFITVEEEYDSISVENNDSLQRTSEPYYRLSGPYCKQLHISQQNPIHKTNRDDDASASYSLCLPPSISRTYGGSCDDDDSFSIDLIARMISNDELSTNLGDNTFFETENENLSYLSYDSSSVDLIDEMISSDEYLSYESDVDDSSGSVDLIAEMILNDELSINLRNSTIFEIENEYSSYESTRILHTFTPYVVNNLSRSQRMDDMKNRRRSLEINYRQTKLEPSSKPPRCLRDASLDRIKSVQSPITVATEILRSPIPILSPSDRRIKDMKNKLRLFEDRYEEYRCGSIENGSVAQRTDITVTIDAAKFNRSKELVTSNRRSRSSKTVPTSSILEMIGAAVCIGFILGFFYFIFVLYKMSISAVIQDNNVRFSFAL